MAKKIRVGLTCPEIVGHSIPQGQLVPADYQWIYVAGGAVTLGYYDKYSQNALEPLFGPTTDLRRHFKRSFWSATTRMFDSETKLRVVGADLFMHTNCLTRRKLENLRIRMQPDIEKQAIATFLELLKMARKNHREYGRILDLSSLKDIQVHELGHVA